MHAKKVASLQKQLRFFFEQKKQGSPSPISLQYGPSHSNTTRSKSYKKASCKLDFEHLNSIIKIDPEKRIAIVEPRVTIEALTKAALSFGLMVPVVPEFKGITVGGAIMGGAAESSSHRWGAFNDACTALEILCGDGTLLRVTPTECPDLFYGVAGSYGSLGALVSAEIQLVPTKDLIRLRYHFFSNPFQALETLQTLYAKSSAPEFLDGILFAKDLAVIIEGTLEEKENVKNLPRFSLNPFPAEWYYQHVRRMALPSSSTCYEEAMTLQDYFFRFDQGAFWMGAYLCKPPLLLRFIAQGILKIPSSPQEKYNPEEVEKNHHIAGPTAFWRALLRPLMTSRRLWKFLHMAEKWVQERVIIQDFCIPEANATGFLQEILEDPGVFPLWLCPIKGTTAPQIFAPHLLSKKEKAGHFINFGVYGLPSYYASINAFTKNLEERARFYGGRKVLYSRSYYTEDTFWEIYSREAYDKLRAQTSSNGVWHDITDKVLSE